MTDSIRPFTVAIEDNALQDLQQRLALTRWPEAETCDGWEQGIPLSYSRELADYWQTKYDWRRCEQLLNSWPNFLTEIDGIDIHFIHQRSTHPHAMPLIISHGWPGSVLEFSKVIDALAQPELHGGDPRDAFHVVAPSLPGFAFSGKPTTTGTDVKKIGQMWGKLMARLGYDRYLAQGGDWGAIITQSMGQTETTHCAGIHVNMPIVAPDPETMDDLTPLEQSALEGAGRGEALSGRRLRLLQATIYSTANYWLRPGGFTSGTNVLDRGEVLRLDGLRREWGQAPRAHSEQG